MNKIKFLIALFLTSTVSTFADDSLTNQKNYREFENLIYDNKDLFSSPITSNEGFDFIKEILPYFYEVKKNGNLICPDVKNFYREDKLITAWTGSKPIMYFHEYYNFYKTLFDKKTNMISELLSPISHKYLKKAPILKEKIYDYSKIYSYSPFKKPKYFSFEENKRIDFKEEEIDELKINADNGNSESQFKFGLYLFYKKDKNCIEYIKKAYEQGDKQATLLYAYILSSIGGKSNSERAFNIYLNLAKNGDILAINYAILNLKKLTKEQDDEIKKFLKLDLTFIEMVKFNRFVSALETRFLNSWNLPSPPDGNKICNFYNENIFSCSHTTCHKEILNTIIKYYEKIKKFEDYNNPEMMFFLSAANYFEMQIVNVPNEKQLDAILCVQYGLRYLNNLTKMKGNVIPTNYSLHRNKRRLMVRFFIFYSMKYLLAKNIITICKKNGLDLEKEGYVVSDTLGYEI